MAHWTLLEINMHTKKVKFVHYADPVNKVKGEIIKTFRYQTEEHCANAIVETMRKGGLLGYEILEEGESDATQSNN